MIGEDVRRRLDEVRNRVDRIESFPENAKAAGQVTQAELRFQVLDIAIAGRSTSANSSAWASASATT